MMKYVNRRAAADPPLRHVYGRLRLNQQHIELLSASYAAQPCYTRQTCRGGG